MTSSANLEIVISAINQTNNTLKQIKSDLQGIEQPAQKASSSLGELQKTVKAAFAIQGVKETVGFLIDAGKAAAEDAASVARLKQAVDNTGSSYESYSKSLDAVIKSGQDLGFTDDQTRSGLAILTAQTGDAGEAMKRYALAEDLARGANIDVVTASRLLGKVTEENVTALNRYGISVQKGSSETELFAAVYQKFHGQAQAFADTTAGKMAILNDHIHELEESLGRLVIPATNASVTFLTGALDTAGNAAHSLAFNASSLWGVLSGGSIVIPHISAELLNMASAGAEVSGVLLDVKRGFSDLSTEQNATLRGWNESVAAEAKSMQASQAHTNASKAAIDALRGETDELSKQVVAAYDAEQKTKALAQGKQQEAEAARAAAEAERAFAETVPGMVAALEKDAVQSQKAAEARREYAAANGLLVDSQSNLLPTMSELVAKTQDSYIATQRDTEARREAYAAMGLETDSMGNLIQTTEQLVRAQEDSIAASIRQSQATQIVAQRDFPQLVEQEKQSILSAQAMAKAHAEAAKQLGIVEGAANGAAQAIRAFDGVMWGPNGEWVPINGGGPSGGSSGGYDGPKPGETNAQYTDRTNGAPNVIGGTGGTMAYSYGYSPKPAPRRTASSFSRASASSTKSGGNVYNAPVYNGPVTIQTTAATMSGLPRI